MTIRFIRACLLAAIVTACGVAHALEIYSHIATRPSFVPGPLELTNTKSVLPVVRLEAPDLSSVQKSGDTAKASFETGRFVNPAEAFRVAGGTAQAGRWTATVDGRAAWVLLIEARGAVGLRLGIDVETLPHNAKAYVWGAADPARAFPVTRSQSDGGGGGGSSEALVWAPTTFGERTTLAVVFPGSTHPEMLDIAIPKIVWQYRSPLASAKIAGSCNLDVTCYPAWGGTASGVGGLGVVTDSGALFCTGSLLADTDPDTEVPYVLTANHCVGGQTGTRGANSLEFYWDFETPACNGTPPSLASVPRTTGGADYLGGDIGTANNGAGNDFTLLRMRNAPPSGLVYNGSSTTTLPLGTSVVSIHHPRGEFKRISFGALTDADGNFPAKFHEVKWSAGTTEPGSSGSPLFRADTQQIIGQLWGGFASCVSSLESDFYGRFNLTLPKVENYLDPRRVPVFSPGTVHVSEAAGTVMLTLTLSEPMNSVGGTVDYALVAGTAQPGSDFTADSGTLAFANTDTSATIAVGLVSDSTMEPEESFSIVLSNPTGFIKLPASGVQLTVIINDDAVDTDGDGLTDREELLGLRGPVTDPHNPDTDGDGVSDGTEIYFGLNPLFPDAGELPSLQIPWFKG